MQHLLLLLLVLAKIIIFIPVKLRLQVYMSYIYAQTWPIKPILRIKVIAFVIMQSSFFFKRKKITCQLTIIELKSSMNLFLVSSSALKKRPAGRWRSPGAELWAVGGAGLTLWSLDIWRTGPKRRSRRGWPAQTLTSLCRPFRASRLTALRLASLLRKQSAPVRRMNHAEWMAEWSLNWSPNRNRQ